MLPTTLFLHGLGDGPRTAEPFLALLREMGPPVHAPDIRKLLVGAGPVADLTVEDVADAVLRQFGPALGEQPLLVGHSFGGLIAIALAERLPSCAGLVLIEGSLRAGDAQVVGQYLSAPGSPDGWRRLIVALEAVVPRSSFTTAYLDEVKHTQPVLFGRLVAQLVERQPEFAGRYRLLSLPRLYIEGAESQSREHGEGLVCRDPALGCASAVVPGAKHWAHVDQPERVVEILMAWPPIAERLQGAY